MAQDCDDAPFPAGSNDENGPAASAPDTPPSSGTLVAVEYSVPVIAYVDVAQARVESVRVLDEDITMADRFYDDHGTPLLGGTALTRRAAQIADGEAWPSWRWG